jgi:hypothetical protein
MYYAPNQNTLQVKNSNFIKFFCLTNRFLNLKKPVFKLSASY